MNKSVFKPPHLCFCCLFVLSDRGHRPGRPAEGAGRSPSDEPGQSGPGNHRPVWRCRQRVGNHTAARWPPMAVSQQSAKSSRAGRLICSGGSAPHERHLTAPRLSPSPMQASSVFRPPPSAGLLRLLVMLHLSSSAGRRPSQPRASCRPRSVRPPLPPRPSWSEGSCADL